MDPHLLAALRSYGPLSDRAARSLAPLVTPRSFEPGAWLLQAGQRAKWVYFVAQGLVRELYIDEAGREQTRRFLTRLQVTGSLLDLLSKTPAVTWIQALEPTETLAWPYQEMVALADEHPELERIIRRFTEALYLEKARREHQLLALGAAARYSMWRAQDGALEPRIRQRDLASYLGITPEHLSRLRRRLRNAESSGRPRGRRPPR